MDVRKQRVRRVFAAIGLAVAWSLAATALAAGGGGGGGGGGNSGGAVSAMHSADADYSAGVKAIQAANYAEAIERMSAYVARSPDDADGENWLAYAYRKSGQLEPAFEHYAKALKIDPRHRGAHEYLGEAYLMVGDLAKAEEELKALDKLCLFPCEEYTDLKRAVAAYKINKGLASN